MSDGSRSSACTRSSSCTIVLLLRTEDDSNSSSDSRTARASAAGRGASSSSASIAARASSKSVSCCLDASSHAWGSLSSFRALRGHCFTGTRALVACEQRSAVELGRQCCSGDTEYWAKRRGRTPCPHACGPQRKAESLARRAVLDLPLGDVRSAFLDTPELHLSGVYFTLCCL